MTDTTVTALEADTLAGSAAMTADVPTDLQPQLLSPQAAAMIADLKSEITVLQQQITALATERDAALADARTARAAAPLPATLPELKQHLVGADAAFLIEQLEAGASVDDALKAHVRHLHAAADARQIVEANLRQQVAELKGDLAQAEKDAALAETRIVPAGVMPVPISTPETTPAAATPEQQAQAEWEANTHDCRSRFMHQDAFVGFRLMQLKHGLT
jgi:hypothetical protein